MGRILHLLVPGLFAPVAEWGRSDRPFPHAPALSRLLSRAERHTWPEPGVHRTLFHLFDPQSGGDVRDLPVASITRLADGGRREEIAPAWWLRADPVSLEADLQQVRLLPTRYLDVYPEEARDLVAECNALLQGDGLTLEAPEPTRWYLRLEADPSLRTWPLSEAEGRDITGLLPEGAASPHWRALLTELQMLLHSSTVNARRLERGRPPINSLWLWGGGFLPRLKPGRFADVYANDPVARGLALLADRTPELPPATAGDWLAQGGTNAESLVVPDDSGYDRANVEVQAWAEWVTALEQSWFAPCVTLLSGKQLDRLHLYPCDNRVYTVTPRLLRRFWRRLRPWPAC